MRRIAFWNRAKLDDNGCMVWQGWVSSPAMPYGVIQINGRQVLAHRHAYALTYGDIPEGMCVCHRCDNPRCINPDHLFLGTRAENNADRARKGRNANTIGEMHPRAKLTNEQVAIIKRRLADGEPYTEIAKEFGVGAHSVHKIKTGHNWRSVQCA